MQRLTRIGNMAKKQRLSADTIAIAVAAEFAANELAGWLGGTPAKILVLLGAIVILLVL